MAVAESTPIPEADLNRWLTQLRSNDVTLRSDAAHQLGKLGDERAVPALVEALSDSDEYVRKSAVTALRRIGGPAAMEGLRQALAEDRKSTRLNSSHLVISYAVFCLKKK